MTLTSGVQQQQDEASSNIIKKSSKIQVNGFQNISKQTLCKLWNER